MWCFHFCRRLCTFEPSVSAIGRSVIVALGLFLLAPILAGMVGHDGYQAHAAPASHAGGPDAFGYTFQDSNEPGGPVYAWEDIAASGTLIADWTSYDDGYAGPIPIGFAFNYYGTDYSELFVGTNGFLSFGRGYGTIPGGTLPQSGNPNNDIALFGGDMYLYNYGNVSAVYYQTLSNPTRFVVQIVNLHYCCGQNTPHTLQVILSPNGDIQAQYRLLNSTSSSYVGIENATGTDGLSYGATLLDNLAIRYYYPVGVFLDPAEQTRFGAPGTVVSHRVRLTNRTGGPDRFDLAAQPGHAWPTTISITRTGVLTNGESIYFEAQVAIPPTVAPGDSDEAAIVATSLMTPTIGDTALVNTQATGGEIAYVTLSESNRVALVDVSRHTVLDTVDVGAADCFYPWRAAIIPAGHQVFVSCNNSASVAVLDTNSNTVVATVGGIPYANGVAFTRNDEFALIGSSQNNQIAVVNTKDYTVRTIATPGVPLSIIAHPYLDVAYAASSDGTVLVVDTISFNILTSIYVFPTPWDVAVSPDGHWVFTGDRYGSGLAIIDAFDNTLHTVLTGLGDLTGLEVAPDGSAIYAAALSSGVRVIDGATFQLRTTISGTGSAAEVEATCDGGEIWVSNSTTDLPVIDTTTNLVIQTISLPNGPVQEIAICPQFVAEGVSLFPPNRTNSGALGEVVPHQLLLLNATGATDSFTIALSPSTWPATLSNTTVGPLAPGQTATVDVLVTIPVDSAWYARETIQVMATSVANPSLSANANVTTVADSPPVIGSTPAALSNTQLVNQTIDQILAISNGNGVTLTVEISDIDVTPEMAQLAPLDLPSAGEGFSGLSAGSGDTRPAKAAPPAQDDATRVLAPGHEPSLQIQTGNTYTTTIDNENNALTGSPDYDMDDFVCGGYSIEPVEFNIFVDRAPGQTGNVLTVRAYDVDWPGEVDQVWLNGVYLGDLSGSEEEWSETALSVPPGVVAMGANLVQVDVTSDSWCVQIDWGELFVAGRPADWLHQNPPVATVATNSTQDIIVTFDSTGLQPGEYQGAVIMHSNDPAQPYLSLPVTMTVEPSADMGRVSGAISDAWAHHPVTATVELEGVQSMTARPGYQFWATAGTYSLIVSASGYTTATLPVVITAGGTMVQDVALEPALARLEWLPQTVEPGVVLGGQVLQTLVISNTGPMPLDMALFEINPDFARSAPQPEDLSGKRILYDRAHGQPATSQYSVLIDDAIAAGAVVVENWYFPIEASVLQGYDILWTNCCGGLSWGFSELQVVSTWLQRGGAVLVQGDSSASTAGPASIFGIYYVSGSCTAGPTSNIMPHPISANVGLVYVDYTCERLAPSAGSDIVVFDQAEQPHIVAKQYDGGKMVVIASDDLSNGTIAYEDNRLLGNNILGWLARPAYSDVPWMSMSPITGTIAGHSSLPISIEFDASGLDVGDYQAVLAIEHNDPAQPFPAELPVTLTVFPVQRGVKYLPLILAP